jgi:hypothetical protein
MNNFKKGDRYYYYVLTGGTDNGDFSRKVYVNGKTTTLAGGGPSDYATLKPFGTTINGDIKISLPKYSTIYLLVDIDKSLQSQTIQFDAIPAKAVGDTSFVISASSSSGLQVQFACSNPKVATVTNGEVKIIGAGSCNIIAFQDGDTTFLPATQVTQKFTVTKGNQTITFPELMPKTTGDPDFDAGAIASSGLVCTLTSSNLAVASIVNGQIHIKGAGSAIINARQAGNVNYNAASDVSQELIISVKTATEQIRNGNEFEIFPNPASDIVNIWFNSEKSDLVIFNIAGAVVFSRAGKGNEITLPVSEIGGAGVYFIKSNSVVKKLVVK